MKNHKNNAVDQTLYKHWLIDEVETLKNENSELRTQIDILRKRLKKIEDSTAKDRWRRL